MILRLFVLLLSFHSSLTTIYHLNESEYVRMPAVFHLDPYEPCVSRAGVYCSVRFQLLSDTSSDLADMIYEYSLHNTTHFDHTKLQYGICVTETCKNILRRNKTLGREELLEGCLNESLSRDYGLKVKISDMVKCNDDEEKIVNSQVNDWDSTVAAIIVALLMLNALGSLNEFKTKEGRKDGSLLTCFSVQCNWRRLVEPVAERSEPRFVLLKGLFGIRTITMIIVICAHAVTSLAISSENTKILEEAMKYFGDGSMVVQIFFIMSGFLLTFNMELYAESNDLTWTMIFKGMLLIWSRLSPSYAVVLALASTWMRFAGSGPLWDAAVTAQMEDCRHNWWLNMLCLNNYVDNSMCMPESWFFASNMQLTILGLCTCILAKGRARKILLLLLFVIGLATPAVHTYFQDLDGLLFLSPEMARQFLLLILKDPTFHQIYRRGHTNMACYIIGLSCGLFVFHKLKTDSNEQKEKYKKYRYLYWLTLPVMLISVGVGGFFYMDGPRPSVYIRALYASVAKPVFGVLMAVFIAGMVFRVENLYRGIFECGIWVIPGRLSYCAYLVHFCIIRIYSGSRTTLVHLSLLKVVELFITIVAASFVAAILLHLLVEAPVGRLVKLYLTLKKHKLQDSSQDLKTKKLLKIE